MVAGTILSDRYKIEERLAVGGMGAVYVATDTRLGRTVAVKVLKEELAHDPRFVERFRREARAAGALSHPNVAGVYDFAEDDERHYIVMELAAGRDLARLLREEGPLSPERTARLASQVARALHHAHSAGVVHRDIKPPNVIVDDNDVVKVTDFGIARAAGDASLTATGSVLGTAQYMSPEQANGQEVGPAADQYSLGIVVYEMVTGSLPFTGDSAVALAMRHVSDDVPPPSRLNPDVPARLDAVVARATQKDPSKRYPDAATLAAELESSIADTAEATGSGIPTSVMAAPAAAGTEVGHSVWPIPGERWDPQRLGRRVLIVFAALALIALLLLLLRLRDAEPTSRSERGAGVESQQDDSDEQPAVEEPEQEPAEEPDVYIVPEDIIGAPLNEVAKMAVESGLTVETEYQSNDEYERDAVIGSDPPPGSEIQEGDTITLIVSAGDEGDEGEGPPDHAKDDKDKDKEDDD